MCIYLSVGAQPAGKGLAQLEAHRTVAPPALPLRRFVFNALEPIQHTPGRTAPIYAHSGERLLSTVDAGELGVPALKHIHHVWPHYVTQPDGTRQLYLLVHGWCRGKFAVLKHEPEGRPSVPRGWDLSPGGGGLE